MVDEVVVFGSVLEKTGPVYTVLGRGELQGNREHHRTDAAPVE
jgi:hypothetical protein